MGLCTKAPKTQKAPNLNFPLIKRLCKVHRGERRNSSLHELLKPRLYMVWEVRMPEGAKKGGAENLTIYGDGHSVPLPCQTLCWAAAYFGKSLATTQAGRRLKQWRRRISEVWQIFSSVMFWLNFCHMYFSDSLMCISLILQCVFLLCNKLWTCLKQWRQGISKVWQISSSVSLAHRRPYLSNCSEQIHTDQSNQAHLVN